MESKAKRGSRQPENSLPNTIVIQLVSAQPPTMPISVHATPLLSGSKSPVEQPRRPAPLASNRSKSPMAPYPSRLQSTMCSSLRRRTQSNELPYSPPQSSDYTNQPPCPERTVWMEYVYHPKENVTPIYTPPPLADLNETGGHYRCNNSCVRRLVPQPEHFMENQTSQRPSDVPQWRQGSVSTECRRDQGTNTDDQPHHLECLKTICETLGQAIVAAAMASVENTHTIYSPIDTTFKQRSYPDHTMDQRIENSKRAEVSPESTANSPNSKLKPDFVSTIELVGPTPSTCKKEHIRYAKQPVIYPKTPRRTDAFGCRASVDSVDNRMESGSTGTASKLRKFPTLKQTSANVMSRNAPLVRRRFPTEELPPVQQKQIYGPQSPNAEISVTKQSEDPSLGPSVPDQAAVVTLPPDPDLCSYSQTEDPCLANNN